ncbi:GlxA family transcriptional regulator [Crenobacter cavernae]|nr:helix-turn-helix domain-containing protein [Crenobacter cavernae]
MPTLRVGLLLVPGCMPSGLFAVADILHAANLRCGRELFKTVWVAESREPVVCAHGVTLTPEQTLAEAACDAVLVPDFWAYTIKQVWRVLDANAALAATLARLPAHVALGSYCTGVALLARAGRLDGAAATTTWWLADAMRERFGDVDWQFHHNALFTPTLATATGANGHLAIVRAFVERHCGAQVFQDIRQWMVLPRPSHTLPVFQGLQLLFQQQPLLRRLQLEVERLPAREATVERVASLLATSPRTLSRRVKEGTGESVASQVRLVKMNQVSERLLLTGDSVGRISDALGFSDESSLRRAFRQLTGYTPKQYRQAFKS